MLKEMIHTQRSPAALQGSFKTQRRHSISTYQVARSLLRRKRTFISKVHVISMVCVDNVIIYGSE